MGSGIFEDQTGFDGRFRGPITHDGTGWTGDQATMLPWGGYAVYNKTDSVTTLTLSAVPGPLLLAKTTVTEDLDGWLMHLAAKGEYYTDIANSIGRIQGASEHLSILAFSIFENTPKTEPCR